MSTPRRARRTTAPVTVRRPHPDVWRHALALVGGDVRRLEVADDGTVHVRNTAPVPQAAGRPPS